MAVEKYRRKAVFADGFTAAGSAGFDGQVRLGGNVAAPTGSASTQRFGVLRVGSGLATATVSTQAINSGGLVFITPLMVGIIGATSSTALGTLAVSTVAQAASGGYFTVGFTGVGFLNIPLDVAWHIVNPG